MKTLLFQFIVAFFFLPIVKAQYKPSDVLLTIDKNQVTAEEFERIYNKNYNINSTEKQGVNDYFNLFVKFKLKVQEAHNSGLDTLLSYKKELKSYRDQLAKSYLTDNHTADSLLQEAYDHTITDINVSHILVLFPENMNPADTLAAYKKIMEAYKKIKSGEAFEKVAKEYSEDPSVKMNNGNLGYFSAFRFPYLFERCAYNTKPGDISSPLHTRYGYHIIKVNKRRPSPGEVKVAHIMALVRQNAPDSAWTIARKKIEDYQERIKKGENFNAIARKYSDDRNSAEADGELPWFGTGRMVPEFEEAAFGLKTPGEISGPIRTAYGWHLIKLIDKRALPKFDQVKNDLKAKMNDERAEIILASFIDRLKKQYTYKIYPENLPVFYSLDSTVYEGKINMSGEPLARPLLSIQNNIFTCTDFKTYLEANPVSSKNIAIKEYIEQSFKKFIEFSLINHENQQLETKFNDFGNLVSEYHDGILLFDIMDRKVWSQATRDSAGLKQFYQNLPNKPTWDKRADAAIFTCKNLQIAEKVKKIIASSKNKKINDNQIIQSVCDSTVGADCMSIDHKLFSKGDHKIMDSIAWKRGFTNFITMNNKIIFAYIWEIRKPEIKNLDEVRGLITADYQNYLEEKWIEGLKNKYSIVINQELLNKIANKYKVNP